VPAHDVQIFLGAYGPRMLGLTGALCDGWIPTSSYAPPDQLDDKNRLIDEAAEAAGRDPQGIRRLYNVSGRITSGSRSGDYLDGPVDGWVDELVSLATDHRMDTFIFAPAEQTEAQLRRFGEDVVPRVREAL
ncbi:MAG: LLM class flavin-dependent oxidoreductase, partial [Anaerolineae bacterium]